MPDPRIGHPPARRLPAGAIIVLRLAACSLSIWPNAIAAQDRHSDFQVWTSASGTAPLGQKAEVRIDGLLQLTDDVSRAGRELVRGVALARLDDRVKLGGGYVWTRIEPGTSTRFTEHRAVQELDLRTPLGRGGLVLALRTQMEERRRERLGGTSLRWRQLTRLEIPLGRRDVGAILWDEYFHEFRQTGWSGRVGPSLTIIFVGVHLPVAPTIAIEPGYLNQTQFDRGPNRVRHAFALFATAHF